MGWFKRLCRFVFGVAGLLSLAALALTWVGPWTTWARSMLEVRWYFITLEVLVCIAAFGLLCCVLVALFAPRNPRETVVSEVAGGKITVTRAAVVSQARHTIEADGGLIASTVAVSMRKKGKVRVNARVTPKRPVDVVERGARLHKELEDGLAQVCGDCVQSIDVVFLEPEQQGPTRTYVETATDEPGRGSESAGSAAGQTITVPMNSHAREAEALESADVAHVVSEAATADQIEAVEDAWIDSVREEVLDDAAHAVVADDQDVVAVAEAEDQADVVFDDTGAEEA